MTPDYSIPVLEGAGDTDYARYMRTDVLLELQRRPDEVIHRDELLFQTVHQSTELWLKLACFEVEEAASLIRAEQIDAAVRLMARASLGMDLVTGQLEMLRHLTPWAFQQIRTVLGHGSGFESPGWCAARRVSRYVGDAFDELLAERGVDLGDLYRNSPDAPLYRLAEALLEWDDRIGAWRALHYKMTTRVIGDVAVGTKGTPVSALARLLDQRFFPKLWDVRSELTQAGPMAALQDGVCGNGHVPAQSGVPGS